MQEALPDPQNMFRNMQQSRSLFLILNSCTLNLSSDDNRLMRYLKGETIDVEDLIPAKAKGWHLVCTDGFPLGWGKVTNGTLKNKYLPGWRNQSA